MKVVIFAGGFGSRLLEHTTQVPKPMVEIGEWPILWHIMKLYEHHGFADFVVAAGYKSQVIKSFFNDFAALNSDWTLNLRTGERKIGGSAVPDWRISVVDTGLKTNTAGRLRRLKGWVGDRFMATYGDGVADVDISALIKFHREQGRLATVTVVRPPARFGSVDIDGNQVRAFAEKVQGNEGWINGGFLVFEREVLDLITSDEMSLEHDLLPVLAERGELAAFRHESFWHPMDTLRDRNTLDALWESDHPPWRVWTDSPPC
jgi:glucose-1-phosphate cytidylyltransferase